MPEPEKSRRIVELQAVQRSIQEELLRDLVGREVEVLTDAVSKRRDHELSGRTSGNIIVNFPGPQEWIGRMARVMIERSGPNSVWGVPSAIERADARHVFSAPGNGNCGLLQAD